MKENLFIDATIENNFENLIIKENKNYQITYYHSQKNLNIRDGEYYTINFNNEALINPKNLIKEITKILNIFLKQYRSTNKALVIGLGNDKILGDSLGANVCDEIIATNHYDFLTIPKVTVFKPNVIANTGINSFKLIKMVVNNLKPDIILIIDSCITKKHSNLSSSIEINDVGILHSEVISTNKEITKETFKIPIISILVPLIIKIDNNYYMSIDTKEKLEIISNLISTSLNKVLLQ